ncbi:MAG: hypothetical protein K0S55_1252 [Clostridia bacterium]|nr:hypothetical protein [Clostridia bacterium]
MQPSFPANIPISKQMSEVLTGKTITGFKYHSFSKAEMPIGSISFENTDKLEILITH